MHLALDILQGMGIAAAAGIRPFLPALAVGALAAGDIQIDFHQTDLSFLQSWPFLLGMLAGAIVLTLHHKPGVKRQKAADQIARSPSTAIEIRHVQPGQGI